LAEDIHHTIFIEGSDITLDLNGHTVQIPLGMTIAAIWIRNGPDNVRVKNGFILGQHQANTAGIVIEKAFNTRIEDVTIFDAFVGIVLLGPIQPDDPPDKRSVNAVIERVICSGNFAGVIGLIDLGTTVRDCIFSNNYGEGFQGTESDTLLVQNCVCNQNGQVGFGGNGFSLSDISSSELINCIAEQNLQDGYSFDGAQEIIVRDCAASANEQTGFNISGTSATISLFTCVANDNGSDGFGVFGHSASLFYCTATFNGQVNNNNGFNIAPSVTALVQGCTAESNKGFGFITNNSAHQFYSNVACLNGAGNYNGVNVSLISSPANVRGVHNVDCDDDTPDEVEIILDIVEEGGCAATAIVDTGVDQFITTPGIYCLTADLSNTLTIQASGVVLNLNAHMINVSAGANGIVVSAGLSNIVIRSGFISGGATGFVGLLVNGATEVRIEDITCDSFSLYGVYLINSQNVLINQVKSNNNGSNGLQVDTSSNFTVVSSSFDGNGSAGMQYNDSQNVSIQQCQTNNNAAVGVFFVNGSDHSCQNCVAFQGANGFECMGSQDVIMRDCFVSAANVGFVIETTSSAIQLLNCVALNNNVGFSMTDTSSVIVRESTANGNTSTGFMNSSAGSCQFYANSACNNGTNYSGVTNAPVGGADCAEYWYNISCTFVCPP
jgi:hypothetical protein